MALRECVVCEDGVAVKDAVQLDDCYHVLCLQCYERNTDDKFHCPAVTCRRKVAERRVPPDRPPPDIIQPAWVLPRPPPRGGQREVHIPQPQQQQQGGVSDEDSDCESPYEEPRVEESTENLANEFLYDETECEASGDQPGMYVFPDADTNYDYSTTEDTSSSASSSELSFASHLHYPVSAHGKSNHLHTKTKPQATNTKHNANNSLPKQLAKQMQKPAVQRQAIKIMGAGIRQAIPDDDEDNYSNPDSADNEETDDFPHLPELPAPPKVLSVASKLQNMFKPAKRPLPKPPKEETEPKAPPPKPGKQLGASMTVQNKDSKSQSKAATADNTRNLRTLEMSRSQSTNIKSPPPPAPVAKPATLPRQHRNVTDPTAGAQDTSFNGDQHRYCDMTDSHGTSSVPATSLCQTCKQAFCATCTKKHASKKVFDSHIVVTLQVRPSVVMGAALMAVERTQCDKHNGKVVEFYCDTCPAILCKSCVISHTDHREIPLAEAAAPCTRRQQQLKKQVETQLANDREMQDKLQMKQQKINDHYKMTLEAVSFKANQVVQLVRQWQMQARAMLEEEHINVSVMLAQVSTGVDERMKELTDVQHHLAAKGDSGATTVQLCEQVVQTTARMQALGSGACDIPELNVQQFLPNDVSDMDLVDCVLGKFVPQRKL